MTDQQPERRNRIRALMGTQVQAILQQTRASAALVRQGQERRRQQRRQITGRRSRPRATGDRRQTITDRRQPLAGSGA